MQYTPYDPTCGYDYPPPRVYHLTTVAITPMRTLSLDDTGENFRPSHTELHTIYLYSRSVNNLHMKKSFKNKIDYNYSTQQNE
jgi:hypothetical protein